MKFIGKKEIKGDSDCKYVFTDHPRGGDDGQIHINKKISSDLGWTENKTVKVIIKRSNVLSLFGFTETYNDKSLYHKGELVDLNSDWLKRQITITNAFFSGQEIKEYTLGVRIQKDGRCFLKNFQSNLNLNIQEFIIPYETSILFYRDGQDIHMYFENSSMKDHNIVFEEKHLTQFTFDVMKFLIEKYGEEFLKINSEKSDIGIADSRLTMERYFSSATVFGIFDTLESLNKYRGSGKQFKFHETNLEILEESFVFFSNQCTSKDTERGSDIVFDKFKLFVEDYSNENYSAITNEGGYYQLITKDKLSKSKELLLSMKSLRKFAFETFKIVNKTFGDDFLEKEMKYIDGKHGDEDIKKVTFLNFFDNKKVLGVFETSQSKSKLKTGHAQRFHEEDLEILGHSNIYFSLQWSFPDDAADLNYNELLSFIHAYGKGVFEIEYDAINDTYFLYQLDSKINNKHMYPRQIIFFGPPGSGKSHHIKNKYKNDYLRVTFHPELDYQGFIGAYKPAVISTLQGDQITYRFTEEAFIRAYCEAWKSNEPYDLIIEEINRGNCAQIFGDIFQLLDRADDGFSEYPIACSPDLKAYLRKELSGIIRLEEYNEKTGREDFSQMTLPNNLNILCTMNTSDQSLFPMDSAFKRRWDWQFIPIDYSDANKFEIDLEDGRGEINWGQFINTVNQRVKELTQSEDKQLGNRFVSPKKGYIDINQFVSKVVFYLWSEIYKDEQGSGESIFYQNKGKEITFGDFFKDGSIDKEITREFIHYNLGLSRQGNDESDSIETN